jgi:glycosyltransferase involved in cell wall biosynthesis
MAGSYEPGLVSVVAPTYNRATLLPQTLNSVWNQTYRPIELIVVDDGSIDKTKSVVEAWSEEHINSSFNVQVLYQENAGAPVARNRGVRASHGEYIQFLDSDDLLSPRKIERQIDALCSAKEGTGPEVAFCQTLFFDDGADPEKGKQQEGRIMSSSDDPVKWLTDLLGWDGYGGMVAPHAWLVPRTIIQAVGPWREGLTTDQDGEYFSRVVLASSRILKAEGKAYYRVHRSQTSQSSKQSGTDYRSLLTSIRLKEERLLDEANPNQQHRVRAAAARQFIQAAYRTYPEYPALSAVAERWARTRRADVDVPSPPSWRRALLHRLLGWKGARIASHLYHG